MTNAEDVEPSRILGPLGEVVDRLADQVGLAGCAMAAGEVALEVTVSGEISAARGD